MLFSLSTLAFLGTLAAAQKPIGNEVHPKVTTYRCTLLGGCQPRTNYVVLDSLAHWVHQANSTAGCGNWGQPPDVTACPTKEACAQNCVQEGLEDYSQNGITTQGSAIRLQQILPSTGNVVSPRIYLLDATKQRYEMLKLTGNEFSFDVNMTKLPCGMNSALYLSEMKADGGRSKLNTGGAYRGTGYCDAQCFTTPFINGEGNIGGYGSCCNELDIWEANSRATQLAPHTCNKAGPYQCTGDECAFEGVCDKNGCGWNNYHLDQPTYYGNSAAFNVNTKKLMTVVTQFPKNKLGKLTSIRRLYVQDGRVIRSEVVHKEGLPAVDAMDDNFCTATGSRRFMELGGHTAMGDALSRGMVLAMSIWWDEGGFMQWLDGAAQGAGPCNATEGSPASIRTIEPYPEVTFSNIKWGEIGSTCRH